METVLILTRKLVMIAILVGIGYACGRCGMLDRNATRRLSALVINVSLPCQIFISYQVEYSDTLARNLLISFLLSCVALALEMGLTYLLVRGRERRNLVVERMNTIYTNCGIMAIPVASAAFGAEGVLYLCAYNVIFNILFWTHGIISMSGRMSGRQLVKKLFCASLIAVFLGIAVFFTRVKLPDVLLDTIGMVGNMNTPLAMITAGATIAGASLSGCFTSPRIWYLTAVHLLLIPGLIVLAFCRLPVGEAVLRSVILAVASPAASICTIYANECGLDGGYSSQIFALTTICSVATMPLVILLLSVLI